jgi:hypothetical protein
MQGPSVPAQQQQGLPQPQQQQPVLTDHVSSPAPAEVPAAAAVAAANSTAACNLLRRLQSRGT